MSNPTAEARRLKQLREEARRLRNAQRPPKRDRIIHAAHDDARVLLNFHAFSLSYSRRDMKDLGITERRWAWAMGLLRYCGMAYRYGEGKQGLKPFDDTEEYKAAVRTLEACVDKLVRTGSNDLQELRQHMPRKYRNP